MRKIVFMLIIVPALLISMTAGASMTADAEMKPKEITEVTVSMVKESTVQKEEIVLSAEPTVPTAEPTVPVTEPEPTVPETEPATEPTKPEAEPTEETDDDWTSLGTFKLTAYCPCSKCCGQHALNRPKDENGNTIVYTASGARAEAGVTIAVDPRVIPYGTEVQINGHTYIAQDTGGAIRGNRIDVYFDNHQEAWDFGTQNAEVFVND